MNHTIKLAAIPEDQYKNYRYEVIFKAYKWDPQVEDHNTLSPYVMQLDPDTAQQLADWSEQLSAETMAMEEALITRPDLAKKMGLPKEIYREQHRFQSYSRGEHVRMMRYDFHPTTDGWALSEVNSDVPGGFAESSVLPEMAARFFPDCEPWGNFAESLLAAFAERVPTGGSIAFVHATSYSDDRQIIQFMHDYFQAYGYRTFLLAPDHLRWEDGAAVCVATENRETIDGIVRYFPVEWLLNLPRKARWTKGFGCRTPSCNHPVVILTQSKRLPLIWDQLGIELSAWPKLLPETKDPKSLTGSMEGWIYKPALSRVGQGISIPEAIDAKELKQISKMARRYPKDWVAQRRFQSQPFPAGENTGQSAGTATSQRLAEMTPQSIAKAADQTSGETVSVTTPSPAGKPTGETQKSYHLCVGVFTVNGKFAGFYGRMSPYPRIDINATDIPVLVRKQNATQDSEGGTAT